MAYLPIKVVVVGTPLSLKREALGLDMSGPEPLLSFGEVRRFFKQKLCLCYVERIICTQWRPPTGI